MDEHLTKPLDAVALEGVLRRYLGETRDPAASDAQLGAVPPDEDADSPPPPDVTQPEALPGPAASGSLEQRYAARRATMIAAMGATLSAGRFTDDDVAELAVMAHNLAGTAGMFGEPELGDAAAALDVGLQDWPVDERAAKLRYYSGEIQRITGTRPTVDS